MPEQRDPKATANYLEKKSSNGNGPPPPPNGGKAEEGGKTVECPECGHKFRA